MRSVWFFALIILASVSITPAAHADENWRKDRWLFGVGLYRPDINTSVSVADAESGRAGTLLDLEDDLDLGDRKTQVTLDAHFRFTKRHAIEFEYVDLTRNSDSTVGIVIDFEEDTIQIGEDVNTRFSTEVFRIGYRYSFINNAQMELSGAIGLHVTDLTVGLNVVGEDEEFNDITAPLPTLGGAFKYHFTDSLTMHVRGEWLDIKIGDVNGALTSGILELAWFPWKSFGGSLGYQIWDLDVDLSKDRLTGSIEYDYSGPKLTLKARF